MRGLVIFNVQGISDPAQLRSYQQTARPTLAAFGGRVVAAYGRHEVVEGDGVEGVVVIEFPSFEQASNWYASKPYQAAKRIRDQGAVCHTVIIEARD